MPAPQRPTSTHSPQDRPTGQSESPKPTASPAAACQKLPEFAVDFIDPKCVRTVTTIGEQTGTGGVIAVRSYVHPSNQFVGKELPIYAPVDMVLGSANYYKPPGASATYQPEYSLYFDAGCGISIKFSILKA